MTINDAFLMCGRDQILMILPTRPCGPTLRGHWHDEYMQSFRRKHGRERCELVSECESKMEVKLYE